MVKVKIWYDDEKENFSNIKLIENSRKLSVFKLTSIDSFRLFYNPACLKKFTLLKDLNRLTSRHLRRNKFTQFTRCCLFVVQAVADESDYLTKFIIGQKNRRLQNRINLKQNGLKRFYRALQIRVNSRRQRTIIMFSCSLISRHRF